MPNSGKNRSTKTRDALGRKHCSRGEDCSNPDGPWLPVGEFFKGPGADGLRGHCRMCSNAQKVRGPVKKTRKGSGDKRHRRTQGGYVCVKAPGREWLGGWFSQTEMMEMLRWASWEEGMVFQQYQRGKIVRTVRVVGKQNESFKPPRDRQILERTEGNAKNTAAD